LRLQTGHEDNTAAGTVRGFTKPLAQFLHPCHGQGAHRAGMFFILPVRDASVHGDKIKMFPGTDLQTIRTIQARPVQVALWAIEQGGPPTSHGEARLLGASLKQQNLRRRIDKARKRPAQRNKFQGGRKCL